MGDGAFWRGAFLGLVVGSLITALTTPKKGSEMRSAVRDKAGQAKNKVGEWRRSSKEKSE